MKKLLLLLGILFITTPCFANPACDAYEDSFTAYKPEQYNNYYACFIAPEINAKKYNLDVIQQLQIFKHLLQTRKGGITKETEKQWWNIVIKRESIILLWIVPNNTEDLYDIVLNYGVLDTKRPFQSISEGLQYVNPQEYKQWVLSGIDYLKRNNYFEEYRNVDIVCYMLTAIEVNGPKGYKNLFDDTIEQLKEYNRGKTYAIYYPEDEHYQ